VIASEARAAADLLVAEIGALPVRDTPSVRALRRARSRAWASRPPDFIIGVALELVRRREFRWFGCELIRHHHAFDTLSDRAVEDLAAGLDSWGSVDGFGRILAGPAWVRGLISDELIDKWSGDDDRWLRRAALVSTVALNRPADGGCGDAPRTLALCERLCDDRDDMVVKALSWALRDLVWWDPEAVRAFLAAHDERLAARVKREVTSKLQTGRKSRSPAKAV
jgi:3-methyladenine DNA glycosylase AlkD